MNETETRAHYIDPALRAAGWGVVEGSRIRMEFPLTNGPLIGNGKRGRALKADYVLQYRNRNIGIVEAKAVTLDYTEGVAQAKDYASRLQVRFTYSTNGKQIYQMDRQEGQEGDVTVYPSPDELWEMTFPIPSTPPPELVEGEGTDWNERLLSIPFEDRGGTWQPRYYQDNAITNVLEAMAKGKQRMLLTLATGTGKTAIAFQISWKLFQARWTLKRDGARRPRILFLADRNLLADQAFRAFSNSFEDDALVRISPGEIRKKGKVPTNGSIFFTIFQTFMTGRSTSSPTGHSKDPPTGNKSVQTIDDSEQGHVFEEVEHIENAYGYMYILQCNDGSFYTGSTKDLEIRLSQHRSGEGAKYTKLHLPVKLVHYEAFTRIDEAFYREKQIQKWTRAKKIALIDQDFDLLKKLSNGDPVETIDEYSESAEEMYVDPEVEEGMYVDPEVGELAEPNFGEYPRDFFDLIIIDECHRGGANDESSWRDIMEYFSPAVQLGLTATPRRDVNGDTYKYFGDPVYIYSLKEGINDGFLTPFRVKEIDTTIDEYKYTEGDVVLEGEVDYGKEYSEQDFNANIQIKAREEYRVKLLLDMMDQDQKTLVFCATQKHALLVRDLFNQNSKSRSADYCHRVTADDGALGEQHLKYFQDNERKVPTVLTTSQKLSTGVDAPEVRNIVLLRPVKSMVEFKQIVGRGTRLYDGKDYFTVYDFVEAHEHFNDPEWDGPPLPPPVPKPKPTVEPCKVCGKQPCICENEKPPLCELCGKSPCECNAEPPKKMVKIQLSDGRVRDLDSMVKTSFWDAGGTPISAETFIKQLFGDLPFLFKNEEELRRIWSMPDTRKKLLAELEEKGYTEPQLRDLQKLVHGESSDLYDVLSYVAYTTELVPRTSRADRAKVHFDSYDSAQQEFLNFVLEQYIRSGFVELDDLKLPELLELKYSAIADAKAQLGSISSIRENFIGFQKWLYEEVA